MKTIASNCPRFQHCSVNNCPLSLDYPNVYVDPQDKDQKCTMEKNVRIRIGSKFPELKFGGMTPREFSSKSRYDSLPAETKEKMAAEGRERLKAARANIKTK